MKHVLEFILEDAKNQIRVLSAALIEQTRIHTLLMDTLHAVYEADEPNMNSKVDKLMACVWANKDLRTHTLEELRAYQNIAKGRAL